MIAQLTKDYIKIGGSKKVLHRFLSYFLEGRPLTTKGRFINNIISLIIRSLMQFNFNKSPKTYFIVGQGRSGSTYLGVLLSLKRNYFFMNEPKLPWAIANPSDDLVGSYTKSGSYFYEKTDNKSKIRINSFYSFISVLTGSNVIIDKYPEMIFRRSWIAKNFPKTKFLVLYRDYKSIVASIPSWNNKYSSNRSSWWGKDNRKWNLIKKELIPKSNILKGINLNLNYVNDYEKSLIEWLLTVEQSLILINSNDYDFYIFNYEELELSLKIFIAKESSSCNDFNKVMEYFKCTHRKKIYNEISYLKYCNKELIDKSIELKNSFNRLWHAYKSNYI